MYDICMIYVILCNNNIHKVGQKYCCLKAWWWILREPVTQLRRSSHFKMDHHPSGPARLPAMEISPVMWTTLYIIEYIYIYIHIYIWYIYIHIYIYQLILTIYMIIYGLEAMYQPGMLPPKKSLPFKGAWAEPRIEICGDSCAIPWSWSRIPQKNKTHTYIYIIHII